MPVLAVRDVDASVGFYRDQLGFGLAGLWGEDGVHGFGIVDFGTITLALQRDPQARGREKEWSAYLYIEDVDGYHRSLVERGVAIARPPSDQFYGCRDFDVLDPNGHLLAFGQDLSPSDLGPGLSAPISDC